MRRLTELAFCPCGQVLPREDAPCPRCFEREYRVLAVAEALELEEPTGRGRFHR